MRKLFFVSAMSILLAMCACSTKSSVVEPVKDTLDAVNSAPEVGQGEAKADDTAKLAEEAKPADANGEIKQEEVKSEDAAKPDEQANPAETDSKPADPEVKPADDKAVAQK